jgi:ribonuclease P protein component
VGEDNRPMGKERRLTRSRDFAAVRRHGLSRANGVLVLLARRNSLEVSRVGFSVGKRVGKAVSRNRTRRRLREAVRETPVQGGWDVVIIARRGAASTVYQVLRRSVAGLFQRAGILESPPQSVTKPSMAK